MSQKQFCANPKCPYHHVIDKQLVERGIMELHDSRGTALIERKQFVVTIDGKEKQFWLCSVCATQINFSADDCRAMIE